ncbi:MAG: VCBS repeat-containing protein [Gammaproteobacteria bacterium]|nr:VCBS repeat-containing protein [Gammaproteobacteria bacterium]
MANAAELNPVTGRARCRRRPSTLICAVLLCACMTATAESGNELFVQYDINIDPVENPTVLTGFFLGGETAEIAVFHVDKNNNRRVQMYGFDGVSWVAALDASLHPDVLFVDAANIGGRNRFISYDGRRVNWFDPGTRKERTLIELETNYNARENLEGSGTRPGGGIPHVDITRDLNHDGRDDLIFPDFDGFWISTQLSDGSFAAAVKLGPAEPFLDVEGMGEAHSYRDIGITAGTIPIYLSRVHEMDYNLDGRSDLVFWNEDHFDVHTQDELGKFDPVPMSFTVDVPIDSDGAYSRVSDFSDDGMFSLLFGFNEYSKRTVLHSLRDLNGDQVADLVTLTLSGRSAFKQRSLYEVHFGTATPDGTLFAPEPGMAIHARGRAGLGQPWGYSSQWFRDFDGDGQIDIMFRDVRMGVGGMARALVGNSVPVDLEFYRMADGVYPGKPTMTRRIRRFAPFAGVGNVFYPAVLIGDVNGDGRSDLLVGQNPKMLHVFIGVPGPALLARQPRKVAVSMPYDERNTRLMDLNKDGKDDLLIPLGPTEHAPTRPHRLIILIAK